METDDRPSRLTASARRAQLIEVGRGLFAERGYEATSVEEIAERAKVSKPIVYEHFGGKEGLYAVVVDREVSRMLGTVTEGLSGGTARREFAGQILAQEAHRPELIGALAQPHPDDVQMIWHQDIGRAGQSLAPGSV